MDKNKIYNKWKPILDSFNVTDDEKKEWISEYAEIHSSNEFCGPIDIDPNEVSGFTITTDNLLPVAMKIASNTAGFDLVGVKPMTEELNEEKYLNERRKKIPDDIFDEEEIDFDNLDKIENTDFKKLDEIKKDFMDRKDGLFYLDSKYDPNKKV